MWGFWNSYVLPKYRITDIDIASIIGMMKYKLAQANQPTARIEQPNWNIGQVNLWDERKLVLDTIRVFRVDQVESFGLAFFVEGFYQTAGGRP